MKQIRTTIIGGIIFLIPITAVLIILDSSYIFAENVVVSISALFPNETIAVQAIINILAIVLLVLVCYLAGLLARQSLMSKRISLLDRDLAKSIPGYASTKRAIRGTVEGVAIEDNWKTALIGEKGKARFLGFEIEQRENGEVVVFQPLTPSTLTGMVWSVPQEHVELLGIAPRELSNILREYGIGLSMKV